MAMLSEEVIKIINDIHPALIATASKEGKPNVSPKGSLRVLDDDHVVFADIASPRTIANLRENPQVAVIVYDSALHKGCRIWGKAEILESGDIFDNFSTAFAKMNMKVKGVVKIAVEEVVVISPK